MKICPTDAFIDKYKMDARKCISYLTIEHKTHIHKKFRDKIGNRIFGCDDCLAVCPWNKFAEEYSDIKMHINDSLKLPPLKDLVDLNEKQFRDKFKDRRGRINCSLNDNGNWRWLGLQFTINNN